MIPGKVDSQYAGESRDDGSSHGIISSSGRILENLPGVNESSSLFVLLLLPFDQSTWGGWDVEGVDVGNMGKGGWD